MILPGCDCWGGQGCIPRWQLSFQLLQSSWYGPSWRHLKCSWHVQDQQLIPTVNRSLWKLVFILFPGIHLVSVMVILDGVAGCLVVRGIVEHCWFELWVGQSLITYPIRCVPWISHLIWCPCACIARSDNVQGLIQNVCLRLPYIPGLQTGRFTSPCHLLSQHQSSGPSSQEKRFWLCLPFKHLSWWTHIEVPPDWRVSHMTLLIGWFTSIASFNCLTQHPNLLCR